MQPRKAQRSPEKAKNSLYIELELARYIARTTAGIIAIARARAIDGTKKSTQSIENTEKPRKAQQSPGSPGKAHEKPRHIARPMFRYIITAQKSLEKHRK